MSTDHKEEPALEILDSNAALASIEKANIDQLIATAHQFPRSIKQFMSEAKDMVTLDLETAEGCYYRLERKGKEGVKVIEGPSVRLLEIAASCYGNIRYGSRVIAIEDKFVVTQGVAHDLQKNVYSSSETRRRITTAAGHRFGDDMIGVTANAACSIAKRNALNGVVPRVYINQLCDLAKATARGDAKTLSERRARAVAVFVEKMGVKLDRLLAKLDRKGVEEITLEDVERLNGIRTAIKEGDSTIDEEFPSTAEVRKPIFAGEKDKAAGNPDLESQPQPGTAPVAKENPKKEAEKKTEGAAPAGEDLPQREPLIDKIKESMLDHEVTETKLFDYAKKLKMVPEDVSELFALPTAILVKLSLAVGALSTKAKSKTA